MLDLIGASRIVLRDWSTGKFPWYTTPPHSPDAVTPVLHEPELARVYAQDEQRTLCLLQTRKEMRKSMGLVRFVPTGLVESRQTALEEPWIVVDGSSGSESYEQRGD